MNRLHTAIGTSAFDPAATEHLTRLFAMSPDLLAAAGFDGLLKHFNDAWEQQLGWPRAAMEVKPYLDIVHPDDRAETEVQIGRLARGETIAEYVCRMVCADGSIRSMAWSGGPGDEAFYIVGRDVSERLAMEHELAQRATRLQDTNAELQDFAYTASHDLSEPLRMVASFLGLLERRSADDLDEKGREYLRQASDGAVRMRNLIDDLLTYSRVANEEPRREQVDLQVLVDGVLNVLGPAIAETEATVEVGELPTLEAEPTQLGQLLQNLIGNAVKFHEPGRPPTVRIKARRAMGACVVSVSDDGIGIDEADQERIFAMFTRLHGRDAYAGTGIGLAICRRIAERHGGRIYVESTPGQGSTFHTLLPDAPAAPGTPMASGTPRQQSST
ncbi:MAG: ATP-binding protein [Baekduia sp.]